jgi:hypothetical protein
MKRGVMAVAVVAALSVLAAGALAKTSGKPLKAKCTIRLTTQIPQGATTLSPTALTGQDVGPVSCPKPFGSGLQWDSFTVTPTTATTGKVSGPYKEWFNTGTLHGVFSLSFAPSSTGIVYTGKVTIAGGTGAFSHIKGKGKLSCKSTDGGIHTDCTASLSLTSI